MPLVSNEFEVLEGAPLFPWLHPTKAATFRGGKLQREVIHSEFESQTEVTDEKTGIAIIHARQDLVLTYSMTVDIHRQLVKISRGIWCLVAIALIICARLWS